MKSTKIIVLGTGLKECILSGLLSVDGVKLSKKFRGEDKADYNVDMMPKVLLLITPSWVGFTDNERLIGEAAKNQAAVNPERTVFDVKRLIGRKFEDKEVQKDIVNKDGKPYIQVKIKDDETKVFSPEEVSAMILTKMKETAEAYLGKKIKDAVVTVPVTDAVIFVPRKPPSSISSESLLASAKNGLAVKILSKGKQVPNDPVVDNLNTRQKGWERMVLQIMFLGPSNLLEPNTSFAQMSQKLIVSPIVKTLVFSKVPEKVRDWIDEIASEWRFKRIIPAHFDAPVNVGRSEFLAAFGFLDDLLGERSVKRTPSLSILFSSLMGKAASYFPPDDMRTLSSLDQFLISVGAVKKTVSGRKKLR
ncbi:unnamed protein product [Eruca vesicaria subsp. sativa]|uniref:Uncharacterized protein n=1 Tax=Eruca vesicaria subsp. sativa TaxID=29727 RepID=A0ABC8LZ84_ERUVS|nr:unnamed protein product [Eruca vesicaria subsp. sativa]